MTTITRQQLRDAIEAGISGAELRESFTAEHAAALRAVGTEATVVARVAFESVQPDGTTVRCPVAYAYHDWQARDFKWDMAFCSEYDRATRGWDYVLHIADDNSTEGEAA